MRKAGLLVYGLTAYLLFLGVFVYAIGFLGNFGVPRSIDAVRTVSLPTALAIDVLLLGVFALQHSGMARPRFKKWLTRYVPESAERSTYVLASSLAMILLFAFWQPVGGVIWHIESAWLRLPIWVLFTAGWLLVLVTTFLINHFDLFGLRQTWLAYRGEPYTPLRFVTPGPYRHVRHPLYVGWLTMFWAAPTMTAAHLLFAVATTAYILIAIQLEERDLEAAHGASYAEYRLSVPMLIPRAAGLRHVLRAEPGASVA